MALLNFNVLDFNDAGSQQIDVSRAHPHHCWGCGIRYIAPALPDDKLPRFWCPEYLDEGTIYYCEECAAGPHRFAWPWYGHA